MHRLAQLDHQFVWHPFTQMRDWLKREPIVIARGNGAVLRMAVDNITNINTVNGAAIFEMTRGNLDASMDSQLREIERGLADRFQRPW